MRIIVMYILEIKTVSLIIRSVSKTRDLYGNHSHVGGISRPTMPTKATGDICFDNYGGWGCIGMSIIKQP